MNLAARVELGLLAHALATSAREISERVGEIDESDLVAVRAAVDAALDPLGWVVVHALNNGEVRQMRRN